MQTAAKRTMTGAGFSKSMVYDVPLFECPIPGKKNYTYDDYSKLPEGAPYQLIGGQIVMTA
ncbi:MAG: hypothetical protein KAI50_04845, partial [Desulfobacterales bacterium]|nr:hypothetical protein [Desulfobacterales bacterium]